MVCLVPKKFSKSLLSYAKKITSTFLKKYIKICKTNRGEKIGPPCIFSSYIRTKVSIFPQGQNFQGKTQVKHGRTVYMMPKPTANSESAMLKTYKRTIFVPKMPKFGKIHIFVVGPGKNKCQIWTQHSRKPKGGENFGYFPSILAKFRSPANLLNPKLAQCQKVVLEQTQRQNRPQIRTQHGRKPI